MSEVTVPHGKASVPVKTLRVVVVEGPDVGVTKETRLDRISIGTSTDNELALSDGTVSRYHLELHHLGDRIEVVDLGSTNGTIVGPVRIDRATVEPGTILQLGATQLRIEGAATASLPLLDDQRLAGIVGRSTVMRSLMANVARVAPFDASVLLLGETGAGKEIVARALHDLSDRASGPFETVDCGALAPALVASELFGHEKGAFTGADRRRVGAFERADGGTLFLDEIGELPPNLQAALLGALERRSFRRMGGEDAITVNVRVVCATNRDLRAEVNSGAFRQDLYYRIAVVMLRIPPLRERIEDLPLLIEHFLREAGYNGPVEDIISDAAMSALSRYRFPGNVRELRNFVEAAMVFGHAPELEAAEPVPSGGATTSQAPYLATPLQELLQLKYKDARIRALREFEKIYLVELMKRAGDNVSAAARTSDINRAYLNTMLKRHQLR